MRLSVVLATRNRAELLRKTLVSLSVQSLAPTAYEVVVCDHGSSDDTSQVCADAGRQIAVRVVSMPFVGYDTAGPKNRAIEAVVGEVVVVLDCGIVCPPNFLETHARAHWLADVMVSGPVFGWENEAESAFWRGIDPLHCPDRAAVPPEYSDPRDSMIASSRDTPWMLFWGCNCSIRVEALRRSGGFDPDLWAWGWDDLELGYRLHRQGCQYRYDREAWCLHLPHARRPLSERLGDARRNWLVAYDKHRTPALELWEVCDYGDYDETYRKLQECVTAEAFEFPDWGRREAARGVVFFGYRCDAGTAGTAVCPGGGSEGRGHVISFGIRTPFHAKQFRRAVVSPYWSRLLFPASPGRSVLAWHIIIEALRVAETIEVTGMGLLSREQRCLAEQTLLGPVASSGDSGRVKWSE